MQNWMPQQYDYPQYNYTPSEPSAAEQMMGMPMQPRPIDEMYEQMLMQGYQHQMDPQAAYEHNRQQQFYANLLDKNQRHHDRAAARSSARDARMANRRRPSRPARALTQKQKNQAGIERRRRAGSYDPGQAMAARNYDIVNNVRYVGAAGAPVNATGQMGYSVGMPQFAPSGRPQQGPPQYRPPAPTQQQQTMALLQQLAGIASPQKPAKPARHFDSSVDYNTSIPAQNMYAGLA